MKNKNMMVSAGTIAAILLMTVLLITGCEAETENGDNGSGMEESVSGKTVSENSGEDGRESSMISRITMEFDDEEECEGIQLSAMRSEGICIDNSIIDIMVINEGTRSADSMNIYLEGAEGKESFAMGEGISAGSIAVLSTAYDTDEGGLKRMLLVPVIRDEGTMISCPGEMIELENISGC
ncbi:MAG: hypothetical protein R6U32_00920 [Candidatus Woesearchaeota archaeon]